MRNPLFFVLLTFVATAFCAVGLWTRAAHDSSPAKTTVESVTVLSTNYVLDKIYPSMSGPAASPPDVVLLPGQPRQLVWLTGLDVDVLDAKSGEKISPEFFCHANLTFDPGRSNPFQHNAQFGNTTQMDWRFFTLAPGRLTVQLPRGFGVPLYSNTALDFFSMSLNQTVTDRTVNVRFRGKIDFVRNSSLETPMKALFRRALYVYVPIGEVGTAESAADPLQSGHPTHPGAACGEFTPPPGVSASAGGILPQFGPDKTIHWLIPPGEHEYRTLVSPQLVFKEPTTLHYATAHLHPFAETLSLYDLTDGRQIISFSAESFADRLGIARIDEYSSSDGIKIDPEHSYELRARYRNTTAKAIDAMAILYLYLRANEFQSPALG